MPVRLEGNLILNNFDYEKINSDSIVKETLSGFLANKIEEQTPLKCLYVGQREYATVQSIDAFIDTVGSDDATTCHIVLIVDESNNNSSLCHFDGSDLEGGVEAMISSLKNLNKTKSETTYSLFIVGGFDDNRKLSLDLTLKLFDIFVTSKDVFNLKLCQVTKSNDVLRNNIHFPIAYGFGYNLKEQRIFMCNKFLDKGPDSKNINIYDSIGFKLVIGPFHYDTYDYLEYCLSLSDKKLLKNFSTSPEQEPPDFVANLKESFRTMINYPNPYVTYFRNGKSNVYIKQLDGSWMPVNNQIE